MVGNLQGWHVIILLAVGVIIVAAVVGIIVVVSRRSARDARGVAGSTGTPRDAAARLAQLGELHAQGLLSKAEYEAKRREILGEL